MTNDLDLLQRYAKENSQDAFAGLVGRHLDLVYSAALRQVRSHQLAEEVAQSVFTDLARSAASLRPGTSLTAWLYQVTRRTAIDVVRRESRRQLREQIAVEMNAMNATTNDWKGIEPLLDEAVSALDEPDRTAILLRYFENKSLRDVGRQLGVSDAAAQKRVSRAVEQLRDFLTKRSLAIGAGALVVAVSANAVQAAPAGLTTAISAMALTGTAVHTSAALTATKVIAMTTLQKALVTATIVALAGTGIYEHQQAVDSREKSRTQQAGLATQIQQLQKEQADTLSQLERLREENDQLTRNANELLKMRDDLARLKNSASLNETAASPTNSMEKEIKFWLSRVDWLKQRLSGSPDDHIPEFQFMTDRDWVQSSELLNENFDWNYKNTIRFAQGLAKNSFGNAAQASLKKYLDNNNGQLPTDLTQLQPFFDQPVGASVFKRYELMRAKLITKPLPEMHSFLWLYDLNNPEPDETVIVQKEPLYPEDGRIVISRTEVSHQPFDTPTNP